MRGKILTMLFSAVLLCGLLAPVPVNAQNKKNKNLVDAKRTKTVTVSNLMMIKKNDRVLVSFDVVFPKISSDYRLIATPAIFGVEGQEPQTVLLPPLVLSGKRNKISVKRTFAPNFTRDPLPEDAIHIASRKPIQYSTTVPYEDWMQRASLYLEQTVEGCCDKMRLTDLALVENKLLYHEVTPVFDPRPVPDKLSALEQYDVDAPFLYPAADYARRYEILEHQREKGALIIHFESGSAGINPSYKDNSETLRELNTVLDMIEADPNASIKKIVIAGFTSIEGLLSTNTILAERRAIALKHVAGQRVKHGPDLFEIINGSEDWEGLKKLVEKSTMPGRRQVLEIIDYYPITSGREKKLMDLDGGTPYRYMAEHFFPQLRNAGYIQIYHETKPVNAPQTCGTNTAIHMIQAKQYAEALGVLQNLETTPRNDNLSGICYLMTGNYDRAEGCLKRAAAGGERDAMKNLEHLRLAKEAEGMPAKKPGSSKK